MLSDRLKYLVRLARYWSYIANIINQSICLFRFLSVNSPAPELTARVRLRGRVKVRDRFRVKIRVKVRVRVMVRVKIR